MFSIKDALGAVILHNSYPSSDFDYLTALHGAQHDVYSKLIVYKYVIDTLLRVRELLLLVFPIVRKSKRPTCLMPLLSQSLMAYSKLIQRGTTRWSLDTRSKSEVNIHQYFKSGWADAAFS